jgi:hypothetical protein
VTLVLEKLCTQLRERPRHFAAGDAEVDRAMLDIADIGWVPAGSPLAVAGALPPRVPDTQPKSPRMSSLASPMASAASRWSCWRCPRARLGSGQAPGFR